MILNSRIILESFVNALVAGEITSEEFLSEFNELALEKIKENELSIFDNLIPEHFFYTFLEEKRSEAILLQYICLPMEALISLHGGYTSEFKVKNEQLRFIAKFAPKNCEKTNAILPYALLKEHGRTERTSVFFQWYETPSVNEKVQHVVLSILPNIDESENADIARLAREIGGEYNTQYSFYFENEEFVKKFLDNCSEKLNISKELTEEYNRKLDMLKPYSELYTLYIKIKNATNGIPIFYIEYHYGTATGTTASCGTWEHVFPQLKGFLKEQRAR